MVELEHSEQQMHRKRCICLEFFVQSEDDFGLADGDDLGTMQKSIRDNVEDLSGLGAQYAREMRCLVANERGCGCSEGIGDPAAARHSLQHTEAHDAMRRCMNTGRKTPQGTR